MSAQRLDRRLSLFAATATNMLTMVGVGPFLTIPLLLSTMHGPQAMLGWILGAAVSMCDGMVWAELGASMPHSGGPYRYLLEAYGPRGAGRLMSFLCLWQLVTLGPLNIASGAVGFAQYSLYLWPSMTPWQAKAVAAGVCAISSFAVYRDIQSVGRLSILTWVIVLGAGAWIVADGLLHASLARMLEFPPGAFDLSRDFWIGLGGATLYAAYDYGGYNNVCLFAGEVQRPGKTIPRAILLSILVVAAFYMTMNGSILGVLGYQQATQSKFVVSEFIERLDGPSGAAVMTALILVTAFASVFANVLGYSRVPYAAAVDGRFFSLFARLHPKRGFPAHAVIYVGLASALACLLDLEALVKALVVSQTMIQSLALVVGATLIRRGRPDMDRPFKMWLYPLPSIVAFAGWSYIVATSGTGYILAGVGLLAAGIVAYLWGARRTREWPWTSSAPANSTSIW